LQTTGELRTAVVDLAAQFKVSEQQRIEMTRQNRAIRRILKIVVAFFAVFVVIAVIGGVAIYGQGHSIRSTQVTNRNTNRQIVDCLDPAGSCYKRSQENQARLVKAITDSNGNGIPDTTEVLGRLGVTPAPSTGGR